ncbi:MAG: winged helix-turn-helix domain-containing protein, partial [Candidatus Amesbacteria bacterium]|nr:winged helix-turn-helix domain-containing protein [Candidatus Amesbacteria bacterium]
MKTSQKIIDYLGEHRQANAQELADYLEITDRGVRKQLLVLLKKGILTKKGHPPIVYYQLSLDPNKGSRDPLPTNIVKEINHNFLFITPTGEKLEGINGFEAWCQKHDLPFVKTTQEYVAMLKKFGQYKKQGLINGMDKLKRTYEQVYLDNLYYLDFYSIDRFGKTKLGQLLLYAKQSQQTTLMSELIDTLAPAIKKLIKVKNITSVAFIPPTVKRQIQFMSVLKKRLHLKLRVIEIQKIKSDVAVPQKSLSKLADRIENAQHSLVVK